MKVETYEIEEIKGSEASTMAADAEAIELIEKMDLEGQRELLNLETATRLPYRRLSALENLVFGIHCPIKTELRAYKSGPIPLRVLQVAALCREQGFFKRLEVWHPEDAKLDPVLIGRTDESQYSGDLFLLARWGEVWREFADLAKEAKENWVKIRRAKIAKVQREIEGDLQTLETDADQVFATGRDKSVSYYA